MSVSDWLSICIILPLVTAFLSYLWSARLLSFIYHLESHTLVAYFDRLVGRSSAILYYFINQSKCYIARHEGRLGGYVVDMLLCMRVGREAKFTVCLLVWGSVGRLCCQYVAPYEGRSVSNVIGMSLGMFDRGFELLTSCLTSWLEDWLHQGGLLGQSA